MSIALTPGQEQLIQAQLATGQYSDASAMIEAALKLLEKRNQYDQWVEEV